jgi:2',3'-cyclic-nucleotide 2'-phosphodiesterase (5'-nucleotidase family)
VAHAITNVTGAEMALINVGICKKNIEGPVMTVGDIRAALEAQALVVVEISGRNLLQVLEQAMTTTFGLGRFENHKLAYPYASGLRYDVQANLDDGSRIALAEVDFESLGAWRPLNPRRFYKVVTTRELADGGHGYHGFSQVNEHWITPLPFTVGDALLDYAIKHPYTWWDLDDDSFSTHRFVGPDVDPTIATVPDPICLEWASDPKTTANICSQSEIAQRRGGGSCGLVAWSLLDQYLFADIALIQASLCASDIPSGDFIDREVGILVPQDKDLVLVRMNGTSIVQLLNNALENAIEGNNPSAYPYMAAIRYTVNSTATGSANRISSVETMTASKRWIPLVESDQFSVLTTKDLAEGQESGYQELRNGKVHPTGLGTRQAVMDYAIEWKVIYAPPTEMYSIQGYIS